MMLSTIVVYLFHVLGSSNMYQMLNYDNLSKEQKLSIKATKALLNNCMFKSKYIIYITNVT